MNEKDFIRKLGSRARMETHPSVDVTNRVMAALGNIPEPAATFYRPLAWMTGVSVPAAVFAGVMAFAKCQPVAELLAALYFHSSQILLASSVAGGVRF